MMSPEIRAAWDAYNDARTPENRSAVAECYLHLVWKAAAKFSNKLPYDVPGTEVGDLVATGTFGLLRAVERFDAGRGFKFETFAASRIHGAMLDGLRELDWVPRLVRRRNEETPAVRCTDFDDRRDLVKAAAREIGPSESLDALRKLTRGMSKVERLLVIEYY